MEFGDCEDDANVLLDFVMNLDRQSDSTRSMPLMMRRKEVMFNSRNMYNVGLLLGDLDWSFMSK